MHALIIEDEFLVALEIEDLLRSCGYSTVAFAVTEADAIAAAEFHSPDLITADASLSEGCGIAAVQAICQHKDIPVVFVTATAREVRERMRDAMVVAKPYALADLESAVMTAADAPASDCEA